MGGNWILPPEFLWNRRWTEGHARTLPETMELHVGILVYQRNHNAVLVRLVWLVTQRETLRLLLTRGPGWGLSAGAQFRTEG